MTGTVLLYRVPDDPAVLTEMLAGIESQGSVPLAVMPVREQLWRRGGRSAQWSNRLSHNTARIMEGSTR